MRVKITKTATFVNYLNYSIYLSTPSCYFSIFTRWRRFETSKCMFAIYLAECYIFAVSRITTYQTAWSKVISRFPSCLVSARGSVSLSSVFNAESLLNLKMLNRSHCVFCLHRSDVKSQHLLQNLNTLWFHCLRMTL
jgi:hypothetical protein